LVKSGNKGADPPTRIKRDGNRVALPKRITDEFAWARGTDELLIWLFILGPGRIALLDGKDITENEELSIATQSILGNTEYNWGPTERDSDRHSAIRARLSQTTLTPRNIGKPIQDWRLKLDEEVLDLCGETVDRAYVWIPSPQSFLELWTVSYTEKILRIPVSDLLPSLFKQNR
jgi:hypothetical protein